MQAQSIYEQWCSLKSQNPKLRALDVANQLSVTEAQLVASRVGTDVIKLQSNWRDVLPGIERLGKIMALTRNEFCVHERKGPYIDTTIGDNNVGLIISPDIDLRFLLDCWGSAFIVEDKVSETIRKEGVLKSIQFFDKYGAAVHKVYLLDESNQAEWTAFIEKFKAPEQINTLDIEPKPIAPTPLDDDKIDVASFQKDWAALKDTHHFALLLKTYKVTRTQALRLGGKEFAEPLAVEFLVEAIERSSAADQRVMFFVGNDGCVQIHTGAVKNLKWVDGWFNVLDPEFDLHLKVEGIAELWRVRKPTTEGIVSSLEAYDAKGNTIIQLYGPRRQGIPELKAWRELVESFPSLEA